MTRTSSTPRHLLTAAGSRLSGLVRRAEVLDRLNHAVRQLLPQTLAPHCQGTAYGDGCLTIFVDNPVWTARVRFYQRDLKAGLEQRFDTPVRRVRVKVAPQARPQSIAPRKNKPLTDRTRNLLQATASGIEDPQLAAALRRLGRRD